MGPAPSLIIAPCTSAQEWLTLRALPYTPVQSASYQLSVSSLQFYVNSVLCTIIYCPSYDVPCLKILFRLITNEPRPEAGPVRTWGKASVHTCTGAILSILNQQSTTDLKASANGNIMLWISSTNLLNVTLCFLPHTLTMKQPLCHRTTIW